MRRWLSPSLAALLVAVPLMAQDRASAEKHRQRTDAFRQVVEDFQEAGKQVEQELERAKTPAEQQKVLDDVSRRFAARLLKLVKADPKDRLSLDMLTWAIQELPSADGRVYEVLSENWADDGRIKSVCRILVSQPQAEAKGLLQKVLDENPDRVAKGLSCFALAKLAAEEADKGGKQAVTEAEEQYERVMKEFAGVKLAPEVTLGELARGSLFELRNLRVGVKAPNAIGEDVKGRRVELKEYRGKVVVLDIWATWCGPCRGMIPHERDLVKRLKGRPFALVSVSADEKKEDLEQFLENTNMPWAQWWSGPGGFIKEWNVQAFPTIYILDAEGVIRHKFVGARTDEIDEAVEKLLAETK